MSIPAPSRRHVLTAGSSLLVAGPGSAWAQGREEVPGLAAYLAETSPTALLVMRGGRQIVSVGDPARKVSVASVRKSLLGTLFGIAIAEGRIRLNETLAELGVDDLAPSLSAQEKTATVGDLLAARSGVYHVSAYETREMREKRPARGSHAPGTVWFYNNWDFNALGTIYRQKTGEDIFESFARRIAGPIAMQDFSTGDGRYVGDPRSRHPAYVFSLSTRDMLRFGEMVLAGGAWRGRQIVPARWLADSMTARSRSDRGDLGYGYLWWVLDPRTFGPGVGFASGYGGQFIAVVPRHGLVLAQTVDRRPATPGATRRLIGLLKGLVSQG